MALNIKDPETDRLARELAERLDTSITEAIKRAIRSELTRIPRRMDVAFAEIIAIGERGRSRPMLNDLSEDEILGYDEMGIPTQ